MIVSKKVNKWSPMTFLKACEDNIPQVLFTPDEEGYTTTFVNLFVYYDNPAYITF